MPELPEVETIVRSLKFGGITGESILNRQIKSADLFWQRTLAFSDAQEGFLPWLRSRTILDVSRRGKFIVMQISSKYLLIHLRMSGDLNLVDAQLPLGKHVRFSLDFTDGKRLVFSDTRKFGRIWLVDDADIILKNLGVEPLSETLTADWLIEKFQKTNRMIKPVLLDQTLIAGLGNIYTDEALFQAGIHPQRRCKTISRAEARNLVTAIQSVLQEGIRTNGASIDWVYRGGNFQNHFRVYQKTGQPCSICGTIIEKITVGQRGTHYCPVCQPKENSKD